MSNRAELLRRIIAEGRRNYAACTLLNQALADRLGLHSTDLQCLSLLDLGEGEPLSTGEIARMTGLTPGSATRLVDRLERAGLVVRCADPGDRRRTMVVPIPESLDGVTRAWETSGRALTEVLDDFTDDELAVIGSYLRRSAQVGKEQAVRVAGEESIPGGG
ncbi:MarR family winged helix-turn-helix transcriptional regulator [Streptosporangium saharense]|uniref:MarR family winged helix-turn-helix transcriptional regulator n=1 Tax=Streptosporangium saharense TaxID=1706840 RepID=UPI00342CECB9